jgi:hypothetical protein
VIGPSAAEGFAAKYSRDAPAGYTHNEPPPKSISLKCSRTASAPVEATSNRTTQVPSSRWTLETSARRGAITARTRPVARSGKVTRSRSVNAPSRRARAPEAATEIIGGKTRAGAAADASDIAIGNSACPYTANATKNKINRAIVRNPHSLWPASTAT